MGEAGDFGFFLKGEGGLDLLWLLVELILEIASFDID
jgi:hypothetical protein